MATGFMLMLFGILTLAIIPWVAYVNHYKLKKTDLTAGDEGSANL